jgi:hypothetical protein
VDELVYCATMSEMGGLCVERMRGIMRRLS